MTVLEISLLVGGGNYVCIASLDKPLSLAA